jgi:hypothetical protein
MAKWWNNVTEVKYSSKNKRFLTSFDMSEAKRAESILNSSIKRGVQEKKANRAFSICTCGSSGCIICFEYNNR